MTVERLNIKACLGSGRYSHATNASTRHREKKCKFRFRPNPFSIPTYTNVRAGHAHGKPGEIEHPSNVSFGSSLRGLVLTTSPTLVSLAVRVSKNDLQSTISAHHGVTSKDLSRP